MNIKNSHSGVSSVIEQTMISFQKEDHHVLKPKKNEFTIKLVNTLEERASVFNLAYKIYKEKGYIKGNINQWLIESYDANSETVIFIVQDKQKNIVGSASLVFDDTIQLPAEKTYRQELKILRKNKNNIAELSRLVISKEHRFSKEILVLLFNYAAIYIRLVKKYDSLIIQVNPRHKAFYKSLLSFDEIGEVKLCPSVQNAPANLLYLTSEKYQSELKRLFSLPNIEKKDKSLYQYFLKPSQESLVAFYLERQVKPISEEEKIYFGLTVPEIEHAMGR